MNRARRHNAPARPEVARETSREGKIVFVMQALILFMIPVLIWSQCIPREVESTRQSAPMVVPTTKTQNVQTVTRNLKGNSGGGSFVFGNLLDPVETPAQEIKPWVPLPLSFDTCPQAPLFTHLIIFEWLISPGHMQCCLAMYVCRWYRECGENVQIESLFTIFRCVKKPEIDRECYKQRQQARQDFFEITRKYGPCASSHWPKYSCHLTTLTHVH